MDLFAQSLTVDKLHRDEVRAFALTNLVDVRDVRMIERCRGLRFLNKAAHAVLFGGQLTRQDLQGDFAFELCVLSQIHFTHSARAEDRKSTRLNSSHVEISYAVFCLKKKKKK